MQHISSSVRRQMGENYLLELFSTGQKCYMAVKIFLIAIGHIVKQKGVKSLRVRGKDLHSLFLEYAKEMGYNRELQATVFGTQSFAVNYYLENPEFADSNGGPQFLPLLMHTTNPSLLEKHKDRERILKIVENLFDKILEMRAST